MSKKMPTRPPGDTPGEEYLDALYTKITFRFPKAFAEALQKKAGRGKLTQYVMQILARDLEIPVPKDKRRSD